MTEAITYQAFRALVEGGSAKEPTSSLGDHVGGTRAEYQLARVKV